MARLNHLIWRVDVGPNTACLIHSDKMQMLQGCLRRHSQSHLLAKKFVFTQMGSK